MEWISVKDRLPELEEEVLLLDNWEYQGENRKEVRVGYLGAYRTVKTSAGIKNYPEWKAEYAFNITHWMPLPEPPTE